MRKLLVVIFAMSVVVATYAQEVLVGATDTAAYMPLLRGKRVAVLANHTAMYSAEEHVVDMLHREGVNLVGIFAPEHGFRGAVEAGAKVENSVDAKTGVAILSLYNGNTQRPSDKVMRSFDILVVDMQDVGLRFYTYYISMLRMVDACADFGVKVVVLDRPNPNGHYIDGPILDMKYKSGVGWLPIPVVHGLTMGEIALMAVGEGDYETLEMLKKVTGKDWTETTLRGYSQSDWQTLYYVDEEDVKDEIEAIENFYMGKISEFKVDEGDGYEYRVFVPDDIVWNGKKAICEYLGIEVEGTTIYKDDGYEKVYKYKEIT